MCLHRLAFVQAYGQNIKVDDIAIILPHKAKVVGYRQPRKFLSRTTSMACPSFDVIEFLMSMGHIRGEQFSLFVNHWEGGIPNKLKVKVNASLVDL